MSEKISRRDFLKLASVGAAAMRLLRQLFWVFATLGVLFGVLLLFTHLTEFRHVKYQSAWMLLNESGVVGTVVINPLGRLEFDE